VVRDNECCAVLGIAVALALAHKHIAASTLPLAISQRLWHWDIARLVHDRSGLTPNLVGFAMTGRDPDHAEAVRESNKRLSRSLDIRSLVTCFTIAGGAASQSLIRQALEQFPRELPFDFESQKGSASYSAKLERTAEIWSKIGQIETYKAEPAPDGSGILITHESPHAADADVVETERHLQDMYAKSGLAFWAEKCFEQMSLGHGLIMPEPETDGSEFKHGEEVGGMLLVARGDASAMLDLVEEPLDAVALAIEHAAEAGAPAAIGLGRDVRCGTGVLDAAAEPIGVVGFIGQEDGSLAQVAKQLGGGRAVGGLAGCEHQFERQALRIGEGVDLGRQSSSAAAHTTISTAFFVLAAC